MKRRNNGEEIKNPQDLWLNGHRFKIIGNHENFRYIKCRISNCPVRGKAPKHDSSSDHIQLLQRDHNHPMEDSVIWERNFMNELRDGACYDLQKPLHEVYLSVAKRHLDVALRLKFIQLRHIMEVAREKNWPAHPTSYDQVDSMLRDGSIGNFIDSTCPSIYAGLVRAIDERALIFCNRHVLHKHFSTSQLIYIDRSFPLVPKTPKTDSLMVIYIKYDHHIFPVIFLLLNGHSKELLQACVKHIRTVLAPNFRPTKVYTDFDEEFHAILRKFYPNLEIHGHYYHYLRAIYARASRIGLLEAIKGDRKGEGLIRKYAALPLMPKEAINASFNSLKAYIVTKQFAEFHNYILDEWMRKVGAERLTVFQQIEQLDQVVERFQHRFYHDLDGDRNPDLWFYLGCLKSIEASVTQYISIPYDIEIDANFFFNIKLEWTSMKSKREIRSGFNTLPDYLSDLHVTLYKWTQLLGYYDASKETNKTLSQEHSYAGGI